MARPEPEPDPLAALRERIRATADAADRLAGEAGARESAGAPPPRTEEATQEARALIALVQLLRDVVPEELRRQVLDLVRQVLLLVRAIIDFYLRRLEAEPGGPGGSARPAGPVVEDIPLD